MSLTPHRPANETTELAKERNREAAERTLIGWIQNCLSLVGFGIAFDRIFEALNQSFPKQSSAINTQLTHIIGLSAITLGIFLLALVTIAYLNEVKSLEREDYLYRPSSAFNLYIVAGSVVLFGLVSLLAVVFVIAWG
ncbi:MAG: DUF202 domain-containing protein [Chroococcidiopsidaceae cyanobacterium CP_BM_RX_35]|nr:DUF202 domain-containing protein [Chroococcidiopsidaceae cyanobacterium CP_BM_RX_35]